MRKKVPYRVCQCMPNGTVTQMEARLLKELVNREIHPIRCASSCGRKAQKGLMLGDLCAETRHLMWALKIWKFTLAEIHSKDYDDWIEVRFNTERVQLKDVISDGVCELIGKRIDKVERDLHLSDAQGRDSWEYWAGDGWYDALFYEKYDFDWEQARDYYIKVRDQARESQHVELCFREAQGELPPQAQDFFNYWNESSPTVQEDINFKVDDWD